MIDTIYSDPDFLMHHGVKGMKWGVRRYQNEDGSLTDKGRKKQAALESKRNKLASKAKSNSINRKNLAKENKLALEDLKKNGKRSKTFREHMRSEEDRAKATRDATMAEAKRASLSGDFGTGLVKYSSAQTKYSDKMNMLKSSEGRDAEFKDLMNTKASNVTMYNNSAKKWANRNKELMNTPITVTTKKSALYKQYLFG